MIEFKILGRLEVRAGEQQLSITATKQRALLAVLLLRRNQLVPIDDLVEALWGEYGPHSAHNLVRTYIWRLRRLLNDAEADSAQSRIATCGDGYVLSVLPDELDLERFLGLAADAREARESGDARGAASGFRAALALWPGEALHDTLLEGGIAVYAGGLGELRRTVLEERIEVDLQLGRTAELIPEIRALLATDPLHEKLHAMLIRALYLSGRRAAALSAYSDARALLVAELGVEPIAELQMLHGEILSGRPALGVHQRTASEGVPLAARQTAVDRRPTAEPQARP